MVSKVSHFIFASLKRLLDVCRPPAYDVIFIQREAFPYGPAVLERMILLWRKPIVFDFDDAIFLPPANPPNRRLAFLKCPSKTRQIIKRSHAVIAGNEVLKKYAIQFNSNVFVLPTPVDTEEITPRRKTTTSDKVVIGWTGSPSTVHYLEALDNVFRVVSKRYPVQLQVYGGAYSCEGVDVRSTEKWSREGELDALSGFDMGLMPLTNDEWTRGKCGFKLLEYMAAGIPAIASPVGANEEIIQNGRNGFLASSEEQWIERIEALLDNQPLRQQMGEEGRRIAESEYSVRVMAPRLVKILKEVASDR